MRDLWPLEMLGGFHCQRCWGNCHPRRCWVDWHPRRWRCNGLDCRLRGGDAGECRLRDGALEYFGEVNNGLLLGIAELGKCSGRCWFGEGLCQGTRYGNECINRGCFWLRILVWNNCTFVGGALGSCLWNLELVAAIVFWSST